MLFRISSNEYAQKSRLFLYPLIGVPRDKHILPIETYIKDNKFNENDYKLIIPYVKDESSEFYFYEKKLIGSPFFESENYYETDNHLVYVFGLQVYKEDYEKFLRGQYSELSSKIKTEINLFWGKMRKGGKFEYHYQIDSYLNPTFETYRKISEELNLDLEGVINIKEILNPPDLAKETYHVKNRLSKIRFERGNTAESQSV